MGQIQNAISGLVSTAIGAGVAKDIKDTKEKTEYTEALASAPALQEEIATGETEIAKTQTEIDQLKAGKIPQGDGTYVYNIYEQDLAPEISKRELSLKTLSGKLAARKIQLEDYQHTIENYRKKRGIQ